MTRMHHLIPSRDPEVNGSRMNQYNRAMNALMSGHHRNGRAIILQRPAFRLPDSLIPFAALTLLLSGGLGCFRATGIQRGSLAGFEIPAIGGDRPAGMKAEAAAGDYYLGNDFVELAVDGTPFGAGQAVAGAASGGSIIDISYIGLDTSFKRVSIPGDMLDRLTPVANQDPELPFVFDRFVPVAGNGDFSIQMTGYLLDTQHKLSGATWDPMGRVQGVTVSHKVTLGKTDRFYTLETTVKNGGSGTVSVQNLGDFLYQLGGGLRIVVPADADAAGSPLLSGAWGVQIPGSDFANPLTTSVRAGMAGFIGVEPAAETLDSHTSLGILPLDGDHVLVASDPQNALAENRPIFPQRVVVGSLPAGSLAAGQSLTYRRKLFFVGDLSTGGALPSRTTGIFNIMITDRASRATATAQDLGGVIYATFGTAQTGGELQTEIRFERNQGTNAAPIWHLERVDWLETPDNPVSAVGQVGTALPVGNYRVIIRNRNQSHIQTLFSNALDSTTRPNLLTPLIITKNTLFAVSQQLAPERGDVVITNNSRVDTFIGSKVVPHFFSTRTKDLTSGNFQPLRFTFMGQGSTPDPAFQRVRSLAGSFNPVTKGKLVTSTNFGSYHFLAGNQLFGSAFVPGSLLGASTAFVSFPLGNFLAYASRGPLGYLDSQVVEASTVPGSGSLFNHAFIVVPAVMPSGWTAFDVPGPSQATGGGMLPYEKLSSALAENVSVVGLLENDRFVDAGRIHNDFALEFNLPGLDASYRTAIGADPLTFGARSTTLTQDGVATAFFTPTPRVERNRGAKPSQGWNLADFINQSEGSYVVVQRPRGPQGIFTLRAFDRTVPLGTGVNTWWNATGPLSQGVTVGSFNALELLRAEGFNTSNPDPWFTEFKAVRLDWFALLNQQTPANFTKGLGLSSGLYSLDTPVGLARTYLKLGSAIPTGADLSAVLNALKSGAAVASTGPLLDVSINGTGPGGTVSGAALNVSITVYAPDWVPMDEVRIIVNGLVVQTLNPSTFTPGSDFRQRSTLVPLTLPTIKDAWIVVEAGVLLSQTGPYRAGTPWSKVQKGMYPIAITNPIFVDVNGGGYVPPGL